MYGFKKEVGDESPVKIKFKIGDKVRISKYKRVFEKGYTPNWTREIFIINKILPTNPPSYKINDLNDEIIDGSFYEKELQKIYKYDDVFKINNIIKTKIKKGKKEFFVNWLGYPDSFNSWVTDIQEI